LLLVPSPYGSKIQNNSLFTACRTDDSSLEIHYTLLKTDSGRLIQIAHMKIGDATGDVADAAFLQAAVLQNFK
jgi:hypothetical protein